MEDDSYGDGYAYSSASDSFSDDSWSDADSEWCPTEPNACCLPTSINIVPPPPRTSRITRDTHPISSEVSKYVDAALKHDSLQGATSPILETVILELRSRILEFTRIRHFRECDQYRAAIEYVSSCQQSRAKAHDAIEIRKLQMCELVRAKSTRNREGQQMLKELEADQVERRKQLVDAHERQRAEHEARWRSPRQKRFYNRPSFDVLQLRNKETLGKLVDAEEVGGKMTRNEIERQEVEKTRIRQSDYDESLSKLEAKLEMEMKWFDQKAAIERERMRQKWAAEKSALESKKKQLQINGNEMGGGQGNQPRMFDRIMHLPLGNGKSEAEILSLPPLKFQAQAFRRTRNLSAVRKESKSSDGIE
jgi:hypothetical protein